MPCLMFSLKSKVSSEVIMIITKQSERQAELERLPLIIALRQEVNLIIIQYLILKVEIDLLYLLFLRHFFAEGCGRYEQ